MSKRILALLTFGLALLAICSSQALASMQSEAARRMGSIPPTAVLDPAFGVGGFVAMPVETLGSAPLGAASQNGSLVVSGGQDLRFLTSSGALNESFGVTGTLSARAPQGGEFFLRDFEIDPEGRLLVVGTSRFPLDEDKVRHGPNGAPLPIVQSAVRILRFLPDGRPDPSFGQGGVVETDFALPPPRDEHGRALQRGASIDATGITVDPQGGIVVTGGVDVGLGQSCEHDVFEPVAVSAAFVVRLTGSGALDASFGKNGIFGGRKLGENPLRAESVGEPVVGPNGEITYRSTAVSACPKDHSRWGVAQLTSDGRTRKTLGREGAVGGYFTALAGESDGSVVALAKLPQSGREALRARLIGIGPNGKADRSFGRNGQTVVKLASGYGNEPNSLAVDAQGRILLGGTLATGKGRSILLVRLSADGRQEMSFGPNGRVATSYPNLVLFGPSDLFFDSEGHAVAVHRFNANGGSGLVLARYLLRN